MIRPHDRNDLDALRVHLRGVERHEDHELCLELCADFIRLWSWQDVENYGKRCLDKSRFTIEGKPAGELVLLTNQANSAENGVHHVGNPALAAQAANAFRLIAPLSSTPMEKRYDSCRGVLVDEATDETCPNPLPRYVETLMVWSPDGWLNWLWAEVANMNPEHVPGVQRRSWWASAGSAAPSRCDGSSGIEAIYYGWGDGANSPPPGPREATVTLAGTVECALNCPPLPHVPAEPPVNWLKQLASSTQFSLRSVTAAFHRLRESRAEGPTPRQMSSLCEMATMLGVSIMALVEPFRRQWARLPESAVDAHDLDAVATAVGLYRTPGEIDRRFRHRIAQAFAPRQRSYDNSSLASGAALDAWAVGVGIVRTDGEPDEDLRMRAGNALGGIFSAAMVERTPYTDAPIRQIRDIIEEAVTAGSSPGRTIGDVQRSLGDAAEAIEMMLVADDLAGHAAGRDSLIGRVIDERQDEGADAID